MGLLTREKEEKGREGERKRRKRERKKENTFTREKTFGGEGGKRATFHWIVDRVTSVKEES